MYILEVNSLGNATELKDIVHTTTQLQSHEVPLLNRRQH